MAYIKNTLNHKHIAYVLLRITVGVNFLGHGYIRLSKIPEFRNWMIDLFEKSPLPLPLVSFFGTVLPVLELLVGITVVLGLFTRYSVSLGALIICALIFGSCMIEQWEMAGGQMLYGLMLFILLFLHEYNKISLDRLIFH
ncbi:DoxX family protein [Macellibacteroides fermentans]|jgi:thiosulfate dehydrogenase [quinone] large subunit|uniref:DoxX family protein n=1 Tax=Macellibacteroides fermentans TaxID=879969 RepID=UPI003B95C1F3